MLPDQPTFCLCCTTRYNDRLAVSYRRPNYGGASLFTLVCFDVDVEDDCAFQMDLDDVKPSNDLHYYN